MRMPGFILNPLKTLWYLLLIVLAVGLAGAGWMAYDHFSSGFSAKGQPSAIEIWAARTARYWAIPKEWREAQNPVPLSPVALGEGRAHFADHCASCHANDGSGQTKIGKNVYPPAPDLRLPDTQDLSDGILFYTIHYGVRFTAMPGWGEGDPRNDLDSWKLVHFIRHLPQITPEELDEMKQLNPKSKHQIEEEAEFEQFLQGQEPPSQPSHSH